MTIPVTGTFSYSLAFTLINESLLVAGRVRGTEGVVIPPMHGPVFETLGRSIRLIRGVSKLIESKLPGEAFILGRSLFEESVRMAQIRYEIPKRPGLLLELMFQGPMEMERLQKEMEASQQQANTWQGVPAQISEQRRALEQLAKQLGRKRVSFRARRTQRTKYGRMHDYWSYRFAIA